MAKRRIETIGDSDSNINESDADSRLSRPTKRARQILPVKANGKSRRSARLSVSCDEDEDDQQSDLLELSDEESIQDELTIEAETQVWYDPDEDKEYEDANWDTEYDRLSKRPRRSGTAAISCIIESLHMYNFMCHENLSLDLGPQVNFIIGHNGSGKSAVLAGITIALGGKALTTSRGNNLQSFIKEGQSMAEVSITLANRGDDSYRPEIYGDSITITRHFSITGSSGYKIRGALNDKVISKKKQELDSICTYMNIQVDNPFCILSQDTAKQFLAGSKPSQKYDLFMRGTRLTQLQNDFDLILEKIQYVRRTLLAHKEDLGDLKARKKQAAVELSKARAIVKGRERLRKLEEEAMWADVTEKAKGVERERRSIAKGEEDMLKLEESLVEAQIQLQQAEDELRDADAKLDARDKALEELDAEKKSTRELIAEKKASVLEQKNEGKQMNDRLDVVNKTLEDLEQKLREELAKDEDEQREARELMAHREEEAHQEKQRADDEFRANEDALRGSQHEVATAENDLRDAERRKADASANLERCRADMSNLRNQQRNKLSAFGPRIPELLAAIRSQTWTGDTPLGPLGMYVDVKPGMEKWAPVLRSVIGRSMTSFVITRNSDRDKLKSMLKHFNNEHAQILISERDIFDFSMGEPSERALTILRILTIKDEFVVRTLINAHSIERTLLAETRRAGQDLMEDLRLYGTVYCLDGLNFVRYREGGSRTDVRNDPSTRDSRNGLFMGSNPNLQIQALSVKERDIQDQLNDIDNQKIDLNAGISLCREDVQRLQRNVVPLRIAQQRAQEVLNDIASERHEQSTVTVQYLEDSIKASCEEKESIITQFKVLQEALVPAEEELAALVHRRERVSRELSERQRGRQKLAAAVKATTEAHDEHLENVRRIQEEVTTHEAQLAQRKDALRTADEELHRLVQVASETSQRVENPRPTAVIHRKRKALLEQLSSRKHQSALPLEEVLEEYKRAHEARCKALREHAALVHLFHALDRSLCSRRQMLGYFMRSITFRTKLSFQMHLSKRSYFGRILVDHVKGTLDLRVQTEDQASTQTAPGQRTKEPQALSGGEKSFSLVCLLLAVWDNITSPLRCLDEFDVFMDAMNRKTSMGLIVSNGKEISNTQHILITPQDMSHVDLGPEVRVHRMRDPERGRGSRRA